MESLFLSQCHSHMKDKKPASAQRVQKDDGKGETGFPVSKSYVPRCSSTSRSDIGWG